ncbi:hypothetical protein [Magnetospirillum molischianum]|uniref:DNA primase n=1 Tax=Magnetospirillum molischianum DSM 120 TaxID=1150626 RepID=H8FY79_MAGML|nr:hypothetical protein [Magnetospirillum molischianum]CCG43317.1 conserved hypothetical protein [Magnetospirillum molischianum DSM 120]
MSREKSQELLEAIDMEYYLDREAIEYRAGMGSSGPQLNLRTCPVCGGDAWKVYIGAETGLGNCFHGSCGATFNKYSFIKAHLGNPPAAVVRAHIIDVAREMGWRPARKVARAVEMDAGWELPHSIPLPTEDGQNLQYLEDRGVTTELAAYFHLRYCHDAWFNYTDSEGKRKGQHFGGRVIVPVFNMAGNLVTFQGRDITGAADLRYLFPKQLPATGRYLYNAHNAVGAKAVCAGEGAFDTIAIKKAFDMEPGLRDVVPIGTFGKHLSGRLEANSPSGDDQLGAVIELKTRGLVEWTTMWDGEVAALEDAVKAGEQIRKVGVRSFVALLPKGRDPNEVPPAEVIKAYMRRIELTPANMVKLRLKNPYR